MLIERNHTLDEYMNVFGEEYESGDLWDFDQEEAKDGTIELDEDKTYWLIDGRLYETNL